VYVYLVLARDLGELGCVLRARALLSRLALRCLQLELRREGFDLRRRLVESCGE
jgi:hypothetical protein